jgi:hypothetical protein
MHTERKIEIKKRRNRISVKYQFDPFGDNIEISLLATDIQWKWLWENLEFDAVTYTDIEPYIDGRTSQEKRALLKSYSEGHQDNFCHDILNIVQCSHSKNSKIFTKPRGGDPYGRPRDETRHIRNCCLALYRFLRYWFKQPKQVWPDYLKELLRHNEVEHITSALDATHHIANRRFNNMPQETKHFHHGILTNRGKLPCKFKPPTKPLHGVRTLLDEFLK